VKAELRIAVLIPARDVAPYIGEALSSAAEQTRLPDEVVVIDDGSSDETVEVVRRWSCAHPAIPLRLFQQAQRGAPAARNLGLSKIDSELVALLDADDVFLPHHLQRAEQAFRHHSDLVLLYADVELFGHRGFEKPSFLHNTPGADLSYDEDPDGLRLLRDSPYRALLSGNFMPVSATVFRRAAAQQIGGYDEHFLNAADRDLNLRLSRSGRFAYFPTVHARKRERSDNLSSSEQAHRFRLEVLEKMWHERRVLGLSESELRATREALDRQASSVAYSASRQGLRAYLATCVMFLGSGRLAPVLNLRHLARSLILSIMQARQSHSARIQHRDG
jgi:glycosyltransferase involved in cell wall biosynthesis